MINELVTVRQAMLELRVSKPTIYKYFSKGWLKKIKIGKLTRIPRESLELLKKGKI